MANASMLGLFEIFEAWQIIPAVLVVALIVFLIWYRRKQM